MILMKSYRLKSFQLSEEILERIGRVKRKTGLTKNNVICRWAFYLSLSVAGNPLSDRKLSFPDGGRGEIAWEVFGGEQQRFLAKLLFDRCKIENEDKDEITSINLKDTLLAHINRGLTHLLGSKNVNSISDLMKTVLT